MLSEADIFLSVFGPTSTSHTSPTPLSTPSIGDFGVGHSFGGHATTAKSPHHDSAAQLEVRLNLAWSTATRYLSLDGLKYDVMIQAQRHSTRAKRHSRDVEEALDLLLSDESSADNSDKRWDLIEWYTVEVRTHFLGTVAPSLVEPWSRPLPLENDIVNKTIAATVTKLERIQEKYMSRMQNDILPKLDGHAQSDQFDSPQARKRSMFEKQMHAMFLQAFPIQTLSTALSFSIHSFATKLLSLRNQANMQASEDQFFEMLTRLQHVGFGGDFGQRELANAMWQILDDFVAGPYMKVDWERSQARTKVLTRFLSHGFLPLTKKCITLLGGTPDDVCQYQTVAVAKLGQIRIRHLFDYIVQWHKSLGAIRDIKEYIANTETRLFLITSFSEQLHRRLLHAGATTTHILNLYINIIHAFNELDSKGVLLDQVAKPIRGYLRLREDTARIIVSSLLAEVDSDGKPITEPNTDISIEIAKEMAKPIAGLDADEDNNLDFDDMEWTPDPIDAGPDFKRSKSQDVTSALLSLYNREDFINELKTILGEHLLRSYDVGEHFEKEERLLELFKNRLGEDKLQACEVMLRDVQSSYAMNKTIHRAPVYNESYKKQGPIELNAHILSSFFWPSLRNDDFKIPEPVQVLRKNYEEAFESVKDTRKLRWMTALGRVTVELQFEDRKVEEEVPTWTASIIYAFQSENGDAPAKTVEQLEEELEMDESLVRNALSFWRSKQVVRETATDTYAVIENLSAQDHEDAAAPTPMELEDPAVSAVKSQQDLLNENAELYKTFIMGMLTNQGNMPLMRIFMMLKVIVPGGFGFGMEEVRGLLDGLVSEGKVAGQGDVFGVKRD